MKYIIKRCRKNAQHVRYYNEDENDWSSSSSQATRYLTKKEATEKLLALEPTFSYTENECFDHEIEEVAN